jgi:DinB superfamily
MNDQSIREHLAKLLAWEDAHVGFDAAVADTPESYRGKRAGPHSPWELVEHIRLAQHDILDFSRNSDYNEMEWPKDYWPPTPAPPSAAAWDESVAAVRRDREALQQLALDVSIDLTQKIPHGNGQTWLRELLLVADHTAYHVAQLVTVRQSLGIWK